MRRIIAAVAAVAGFSLCCLTAQAAVRVPTTPTAVAAYATVLHRINPQMSHWQSKSLARHVLVNASHWKIDPNLLVAIVTVESRWHTHARSDVGAIGLGQLMPETAHSLHVDPRDPAQNLAGAARYLSGLITRFRYHHNHFELACAAYNAGPHAVSAYGGIPPYYETQHYVAKVMSTWRTIAKSVHVERYAAAHAGAHAPDVAFWSSAE